MADGKGSFEAVSKHPDRYYIIHYSSQSLFDAEAGAFSPRITSVVIRHFQSGQTVSFATHTTAEILGVSPEETEARYDDIECHLLTQFYDFVRDRREKYWLHWNMRNVVFGFEHLEHRYRKLTGKEPPSIPVEVRFNISDMLKSRYGSDYAEDPKIPTLMEMNGGRVQGFLTGKEEADAFAAKDFIRMNTSTIAKVGFFSHVISSAMRGKLKTAGSGISNWIDRLLESRKARIIAFTSAAVAIPAAVIQLLLWAIPLLPHSAERPAQHVLPADRGNSQNAMVPPKSSEPKLHR